ncbi:hypothetical protein [Cytobacillus solani]|uniref:hypothetical protein n=1 Tax=Cytobacillus solani TaxID=1637975 RepID=UPI003CCC12E4
MSNTCANCSGDLSPNKPHLYDDHAELTFCDSQCWREWAVGAGEGAVLAFYAKLNLIE